MSFWPKHVRAHTTHARLGAIDNAFRYGVDFALIDPGERRGPTLFSRNRFNLAAVHDRDHGGPLGNGSGLSWARKVLEERGLKDARILLLTQPRFLGYVFNPVSFWLAFRGNALVAVIAEVNTPFRDRHSYVCHLPGFRPIRPSDRITAPKHMHVSPFQDVEGDYTFNFDIRSNRIAIRIVHRNGEEGLVATLTGSPRPMSSLSLVLAFMRRPAGAVRTILLIYLQALRLKIKGARFRPRPEPGPTEIT